MTVQLFHGDCLDVLPTLPECSVDSIITDPPYGLSFMGKDWDHGIPGVRFWTEALRVAKPGATLLAFGGTRTHHRLMVAIEDAGWEIRDVVMWVYGSGFPKSHDIGKAIDKAAGAEREVVGIKTRPDGTQRPNMNEWDYGSANDYGNGKGLYADGEALEKANALTAPATPAAAEWDGWGTALKPAWEPIIVAMKPRDGTFANNAQVWGVAGLNVDGGRVEGDVNTGKPYAYTGDNGNSMGAASTRLRTNGGGARSPSGRWPANLIHDGSEEVVGLFPESDSRAGNGDKRNKLPQRDGQVPATSSLGAPHYGSDSGSAARFFYCAKASRSERDAGLEVPMSKLRDDLTDDERDYAMSELRRLGLA